MLFDMWQHETHNVTYLPPLKKTTTHLLFTKLFRVQAHHWVV